MRHVHPPTWKFARVFVFVFMATTLQSISLNARRDESAREQHTAKEGGGGDVEAEMDVLRRVWMAEKEAEHEARITSLGEQLHAAYAKKHTDKITTLKQRWAQRQEVADRASEEKMQRMKGQLEEALKEKQDLQKLVGEMQSQLLGERQTISELVEHVEILLNAK